MSEHDLPVVSIVTPCFNAARYIEAAIESVLAQDYPRIEYLVMDAGSTDGTVEILKRYASTAGKRPGPLADARGSESAISREGTGPLLKFVSEPDAGAADAINRGF